MVFGGTIGSVEAGSQDAADKFERGKRDKHADCDLSGFRFVEVI